MKMLYPVNQKGGRVEKGEVRREVVGCSWQDWVQSHLMSGRSLWGSFIRMAEV